MDEEKTDPGGGNAGLFNIVSDAFARKVTRVSELAGYLDELPPHERDAEFWRLANALREMLDVGEDFHRIVSERVQSQPTIEITQL